jgi:hypothetical protein
MQTADTDPFLTATFYCLYALTRHRSSHHTEAVSRYNSSSARYPSLDASITQVPNDSEITLHWFIHHIPCGIFNLIWECDIY